MVLHRRWQPHPNREVMLKSPAQMQEMLDLTQSLLTAASAAADAHADASTAADPAAAAAGNGCGGGDEAAAGGRSGSDAVEQTLLLPAQALAPAPPRQALPVEQRELDALEQILAVLDDGGCFTGFHRKVQLKPKAWHADGSVARLYFTSESHIQSLMGVLRYCHRMPRPPPLLEENTAFEETGTRKSSMKIRPIEIDTSQPEAPYRIVSEENERRLYEEPTFDYLTQVVFRLYEDLAAPAGTPGRYCVEVLFSPGTAGDPVACSANAPHVVPLTKLERLNEPMPLQYLQQLLSNPLLSAAMRSPPISPTG
eukprot:NODE_7933_length_1536_cov_5.418027.p1 GENE.NODE_7933_length_1536_cov_5.418027~~NODE_7933_length_1536_cov_5.418027.p1  ORF type:complete len:311 (-),score=96.38 NODE_7933_length_1536_cov_5.418027:602-1534(-)